ncbi:hypothetical protein [Nocardia fluminea]|uniref:hypothetical protein n=1 Tax=Nocardia fluminea TaxID=134984 RepID=UPI0037BCB99B
MLVRTEAMPQIPQGPTKVRVHTPMGVVEVLWRGDPQERDGCHHIEWTVDEEICWGRNAEPSTVPEPGLRQEGGRVIMRGQLHVDEDGGVDLQVGDSSILFDLASPIPAGADRRWVEVNVAAETVSLYPFQP